MRAHLQIGFWLTVTGMACAQSVTKIDANPDKGFSWPYYLSMPANAKSPPVLLVIPNNTGTAIDDPAVHDGFARGYISSVAVAYEPLFGVPILMPAFPRPASNSEVYTHALNREALLTKLPGLERLDLQLVAMIQDARPRLSARGITVDAKVWMQGYSASGSFVSRFTALHPELVRAASIGSPGFGPIMPVEEWNGIRLPYPVGVADLEEVAGAKFNLEAFRQVALQLYVGDMDDNIVPWFNPQRDAEVALISQLGFKGPEDYRRWPQYEAAYQSVGANALFTVYPKQVHNFSTTYFYEIFEKNRRAPAPVIPPKPRHHRLCFPQVLVAEGLDTELVLLNTSDVTIRGDLQALRSEGGRPNQIVGLTLAPHARVTVAVSKTFANPKEIASVILAADSGFLSAFARVGRGDSSVTVPAAEARPRGVLIRAEGQGPATLALLNVEDSVATVRLWAYDDAGLELAQTSVRLTPWARLAGSPENLFRASVSRATQFRYYSDRGLVGLALSDSPDKTSLSVLPAAPEYFR